jgi:hypothetical protein
MEWDLGLCISSEFSGDAGVAGPSAKEHSVRSERLVGKECRPVLNVALGTWKTLRWKLCLLVFLREGRIQYVLNNC